MKVLQILNRIYVKDLESAVAFYETILEQKSCLRFSFPEIGLALAQVGGVLILAGTDEKLRPYKETTSTFVVDSVKEWKNYLLGNRCSLIRDIKAVPTGYNLTVRHPDGAVIEYVQFEQEKLDDLK